jgi:ATP-dependent Lon protease
VGGIKEKALAAHRAGITTLILPRQNEKALVEDVPPEVRAQLTVHLVSTVGEVLRLAFADEPPVPRESPRAAALAGHTTG